MKRKVKLSFEALERELNAINAQDANAILGGNSSNDYLSDYERIMNGSYSYVDGATYTNHGSYVTVKYSDGSTETFMAPVIVTPTTPYEDPITTPYEEITTPSPEDPNNPNGQNPYPNGGGGGGSSSGGGGYGGGGGSYNPGTPITTPYSEPITTPYVETENPNQQQNPPLSKLSDPFSTLMEYKKEIGSQAYREYIANLIGGTVAYNIENDPAYSDLCAVNLSLAINMTGNKIPSGLSGTNTGDFNRDGISDNFFFRASDMFNHYSNQYGAQAISNLNEISGQKGIIYYDNFQGSDPNTGEPRTYNHIDYYDGSKTIGKDYSDRNGVTMYFIKLN